MFRHWPSFHFDPSYSRLDQNMIGTATNRIAITVYRMLSPFADEDLMYKDLRIEFVPEQNLELRKYGALGLAYRNRNINNIPRGLGRWTFAAYTGLIAMELTHSVLMRLISHRAGNDIIHYLYNEGRLLKMPYRSQWNLKYFGGELTLVIPDMRYGWVNQGEIMEGIKSGKYKEGTHEYWSDVSPATRHDLEHIKEFLIAH